MLKFHFSNKLLKIFISLGVIISYVNAARVLGCFSWRGRNTVRRSCDLFVDGTSLVFRTAHCEIARLHLILPYSVTRSKSNKLQCLPVSQFSCCWSDPLNHCRQTQWLAFRMPAGM